MPSLAAIYAGDPALHMAVLCHHHAAVHAPQCLHGGVRHLPCRFARRHQQHSAALWLKGFQRTAHSFVWKHRLNAGTDNCIGVPPQCGIHETDLPIRSADAACAIHFSRKIIAQCKIHLQASRPCRSRALVAYKTKKP